VGAGKQLRIGIFFLSNHIGIEIIINRESI
jgi:hypothetical protein